MPIYNSKRKDNINLKDVDSFFKEEKKPVKAKKTSEDLFNIIEKYVSESEANTAVWSTHQEKWHKIRMRIKKAKTFPFIGSSNIRMPTAEINIRKIKAAVMGVIFGIRPVVQVTPGPTGNIQTADKIEKFLDHLVMDIIKIQSSAEICVDQSLEKGFYLMKPFWKREIIDRKEHIDLEDMPLNEVMALIELPDEILIPEIIRRLNVDTHTEVVDRNIEKIKKSLDDVRKKNIKDITIIVEDVIYDFPAITVIAPEKIYVPTDSGFNIQDLKCITHEFFLPLDEIKRNVEFRGWDKDIIDELEVYKSIDIDKNIDLNKNTREGIQRMNNPSGLVRVWETYGWIDIDGDEKVEKSVITSFPDFKLIARKILIPFLSGKYPFVKAYYELTDDRWFSHRGIPEILEDIIKEIDVQHNMKIDSQTIRNAPMFVFRAGMINPNLVQMIPNQGIPVNGMQPLRDTIDILNMHNPNVEFSYEREQMLLETKVQEMVGQVDFSLQSMINKRQPRTLGEVQEQAVSANRVFSLDANHYIEAFTELFNMIFELWCEFGQDEYEFKYFGETTQGESIKLTKEEIQGRYKISIRGNDQNTNPQIKLQKAQQILLGARDPMLLQLGVITPQHVAMAMKRFYQALGVDKWEELIDINPQPIQQDPAAGIKPMFMDLTDAEKGQVLAKMGIRVDSQGRFSKMGREIIEEAADIANKVG